MAEVCCEVCWACYQFYTAAEFALTLWSNGCNHPYAHHWWNGGIDHNSVMVTYHEKSGMSLSPTKYQCTQSYVVVLRFVRSQCRCITKRCTGLFWSQTLRYSYRAGTLMQQPGVYI